MRKRAIDWRTLVGPEGDEGSVYQAALLCNACTSAVCEELAAQGKAPEDLDDEGSWDSDDYPKRSDLTSEESDSPQHCGSHEGCLSAVVLPSGGKIGAWLGGSLTGEGESWLAQEVRDAVEEPRDEHRAEVCRLWRLLYADQLSEHKDPDLLDVKRLPARRLGEKALAACADLDALYGIYEQRRDPGSVIVDRIPVDERGRPAAAETALIDASRFEGRPVVEALAEVIDEEAWG